MVVLPVTDRITFIGINIDAERCHLLRDDLVEHMNIFY